MFSNPAPATAESPAGDAGCDTVMLAGETVVLSAGRALSWPRERTLFVADAHPGKAASFRRVACRCRVAAPPPISIALPRWTRRFASDASRSRRRALLPAFGRMTGLALVHPAPGERLVAIAGWRLFTLPAA
jgi:hypothetical protein